LCLCCVVLCAALCCVVRCGVCRQLGLI